MTPLDTKNYEETVVKPLRRRQGRLPDDLLVRYVVDLTMTDTELVKRLAEVRSHWNKRAHNAKVPALQSIYKAFLRADEELTRAHGPKLTTIGWWRDREQATAGKKQAEVTALAEMLRASFGDLGLIAEGQLEATMLATSTSLAPADVETALTAAGVRRDTPLELPRSSGLLDSNFRTLCGHLVDADVASIPQLLFGEIVSFQVLDAFTCKPAQSLGLTEQAVRQAVDRENKRSDNHAARQALSQLTSAAKDGLDLRGLTLFHILRGVRQLQGAPVGALLRQLADLRVDPDEARRIVFSLNNESARGQATGLAAIKALLGEGRLVAAQQTLATMTGSDDRAAAKALVEQQLAEVRRLREAAQDSLGKGAEADALHTLRQAAALACDDDEIVAELRRIPPAPVLALSAQPEGVGVRVSWRPAPSHERGTRYRLVRTDGRPPADPDDGTVVPDSGKTVVVDARAPAGRLVGYGVFTAVEDGPWSRPTSATIEVLPPVHNVQVTAENGVVDARWHVHPEVHSVHVRRDDGVAVAASGNTAFHDRTAGEDASRTYTLVANYRRADGTDVSSVPIVVRTMSQGKAVPVPALRLAAAPAEHGARVAITWRQAADAEVVVRRSGRPCGWAFGDMVALAGLADYGDVVEGKVTDKGEWRTLTADVPTGRFHYVPFTLGASGAVRGQDAELGIALPVTNLTIQRLGEELALSWVWPEHVGLVDVSWRSEQDSATFRLTRQQYLVGGGCRIRVGRGYVVVKVSTVLQADGGECVSAAVERSVPQRPPKVSYSVELARTSLLGQRSVRVRLTADQAVARCTVLVVVAPGPVMPRRPSDGQLLLRSDQQLQVDQEIEISAPLPKLRRPYWVRCFLDGVSDAGSAHLVDPPTKQLKVS